MISLHRGCDLTAANPSLQAMFEDRKRQFVDQLGWAVPIVDGRYEIDQFDGDACTYLIATSAAELHIGSMRLLPTDRAHLLDTLFPALCDGPVPRGPAVREITRLCLPSRFGAAGRLDIRNRLISAMVDHALADGIDRLTGLVEVRFLTQIIGMGWDCAPLGEPQRIGSGLVGAFRIDLTPETPAALARRGIYMPGTLAQPRAAAA